MPRLPTVYTAAAPGLPTQRVPRMASSVPNLPADHTVRPLTLHGSTWRSSSRPGHTAVGWTRQRRLRCVVVLNVTQLDLFDAC